MKNTDFPPQRSIKVTFPQNVEKNHGTKNKTKKQILQGLQN